jgi:uncharacterized NAD(P)/FAD-binding protein YdhS
LKKIAIVGGGASGILVAVNLAKQSSDQVHVSIVEPRKILGQGIAYSTMDEGHVLNVPAGRMSIYVDDAGDFVNWAGCDKNYFAPRKQYFRYLLERFNSARGGNVEFTHFCSTADSIEKDENKWRIICADGQKLLVDAVVIAIGHGEAIALPNGDKDLTSSGYIDDPWRNFATPKDGHMIGIGTGLTFIDYALSHIRRNEKNTATGISRNGLLPEQHLQNRAEPLEVPAEVRTSPSEIRQFIENSQDWRAAQDGVRHQLPEIWHNWSNKHKSDFLSNDLRWWNVKRHRLAPEIADEVRVALEEDRIKIVQGQIERVNQIGEVFSVALHSGEIFRGETVVNCLGYSVAGTGSVIDNLVKNKLAVPAPLGLGLCTDFPRFNVINSENRAHPNLFAIGPILFGERFETTAIPELREQADEIAKSLIKSLQN